MSGNNGRTVAINGVINVLKPPGMTSFDVVAALRGIVKTKKIGHTGTLDPAAAGVLPVCIGNATKAIEYLTEKSKEYRAELTLGIITDTQDATGRIIKESEAEADHNRIIETLASFKGKQKQIPPMYSAVSINGVRLYKLARSGMEIERDPREIEIFKLDLVDIQGAKVLFDVECSKGTYIRTLCSDIGDRLGCGGHMSFLLRLRAGQFDIENALTFEEISELVQAGTLEEHLARTDTIFTNLQNITLNIADEKKLLNGAYIHVPELSADNGELVRVYDSMGSFLAIAEVNMKEKRILIKSKKLFVS